MTIYVWEGLDSETGKRRHGRITAQSESQVRASVAELDVAIVGIKPMSKLLEAVITGNLGRTKAKIADRSILYRSMAMAAATEKPLIFALDSALTGLKKGSKLRPAIARIRQNVQNGMDADVALDMEAVIIGEETAPVYRAAINTATPELALESLSTITEQTADIAGKVRVALIQPAIYMVMTLAAIVVVMATAIPSLADTYEDFDAELPLPTRVMIGISNFVSGNLILLGLMTLGAIAGGVILWKQPKVRMACSKFAYQIPITGSMLSSMASQRICALMGVMLSADVQHSEALQITAQAMKSPSVKHDLLQAAQGLRNSNLAEVMNAHLAHLDQALPALAEQSASGLLDAGANWTRYGAFKHRDTDRRATGLSDALEPILIMFIGVFIGALAIAFYLPMFNVFGVVSDSSGL